MSYNKSMPFHGVVVVHFHALIYLHNIQTTGIPFFPVMMKTESSSAWFNISEELEIVKLWRLGTRTKLV